MPSAEGAEHECVSPVYFTPKLCGEFSIGENIDPIAHKVGVQVQKFFRGGYGVESS